jgi:co-chaperonin GroES (HSP10)
MNQRINPTKLLIKELPKEEKVTQAGIIIPGVVREPSAIGKVIFAGTGTPQIPMTVSVGDTVLFSPHAIQKVNIPDREETKELPFSGELLLLDIKDCLLAF